MATTRPLQPTSWLQLDGRRALVTGGTQNIGRRIAVGLAEAGAHVYVHGGSDQAALDATLEELAALPGECDGGLQELGDAAGVRAFADDVVESFGPVDILINNAAIRPRADLVDIESDDWDEVMAVDLRAPFLLAQRFVPGMIERGFGRVVNISGMDAYWGRRARAHVSTAKLGIVGLSRALASECAQSGVTVNTVVPGTIDTQRKHLEWYPGLEERYQRRSERIPMGRLGTPQEVADTVLFLTSPRASYTTGQEFFLSGGGYPLVQE